MIQTYRTVQGDVLDDVCNRLVGPEEQIIIQALQLNPHIASFGPILPTGTVLKLPELIEQDFLPELSLWDE